MANARIQLITEEVRFLYPNIIKPRLNTLSGKEEYSLVLLIDKKDKEALKPIQDAIQSVVDEQWAKKPNGLKLPLKDGDALYPDDETFKGKYFLNAKNKDKIGAIDGTTGLEVISADIIYGGCYGRADITISAFDQQAAKGVSIYLNNVMKTKDGEYLGGKRSAKSAFAEFLPEGISEQQMSEDDVDDLLS